MPPAALPEPLAGPDRQRGQNPPRWENSTIYDRRDHVPRQASRRCRSGAAEEHCGPNGRLSTAKVRPPSEGPPETFTRPDVPTGHLVYGQDPGSVRAIPFDPTSLTITGSPVSIVDSVERAPGGGAVYFGVSRTGLLVYASTGDRHQLAWVDRNGTATPISATGRFRMPRLSRRQAHCRRHQ